MVAAGKATSKLSTESGEARVTVLCDFAGRCTAPLQFRGTYARLGTTGEVKMAVRCRRCDGCLRTRRAQWAYRCVAENLRAPKTYFVTLTLAPASHYLLQCRAIQTADRPMIDADGVIIGTTNEWDTYSPHMQSWRMFQEIGKEVTKYLKRVRKAVHPYCRIRYSMFNELGDQGGREHVHLLVHVHPTSAEVPWDDLWWALVSKWKRFDLVPGTPLGIAEAEPVRHSEKGGWYVAGYLQDSSHSRARASMRYGKAPPGAAPSSPS